jgi:hypothetical protein
MTTPLHDGSLASDNWRPKWQCIRERQWVPIRDSWVQYVPTFAAIADPPNPGLENLATLLEIEVGTKCEASARHADVAGLRKNILWEAVFLFHKCSHTNLAAQRLALSGMHSWCQFNAYHSAFIGAKGIMSMLGVAFPKLKGKQAIIDVFPEPEKRIKKGTARAYDDFIMFSPGDIEQRRLWEGFIRVLNVSEAPCWDTGLSKNLVRLNFKEITPPRNRFLYKAQFWPDLGDLALDATGPASGILADGLNVEDDGFLLSLSCSVYRLFEELMKDLAKYSPAIEAQFYGSRCVFDQSQPELMLYKDFLSMRSLQ